MRANQHGCCKPGRLCTHLSLGNAFFLHIKMENLHLHQECLRLSAHISGHPSYAASPRGRSLKSPSYYCTPQVIPESSAVIREQGDGGRLEIQPLLFSLGECVAGKHRHPVFQALARK